ncbi:MAG: cytochrome c [Elusimicrobia bacterium]|nr:cytochrome c [Elusimicrobiota bacterium]
MRLKTSACLVILAAAALAACQRASSPEARGQAYFNALGCRQCHQVGAVGGSYGPNLTFIGFRKSPQWLDAWLKNPHSWRKQTVMPNFNLNQEMRAALVAYLSTQKGQAWEGGRPWNHPEILQDPLKRGEMIFNLAGCVACHAEKGRGGYPNNNVVGGLIPSLTKVAEGYSKEELEKKIAGGVFPAPADPNAPPPMIFMPKWAEVLKQDEISAVADYLISLAPKKGPTSEW